MEDEGIGRQSKIQFKSRESCNVVYSFPRTTLILISGAPETADLRKCCFSEQDFLVAPERAKAETTD
jgi:hypothetical protein